MPHPFLKFPFNFIEFLVIIISGITFVVEPVAQVTSPDLHAGSQGQDKRGDHSMFAGLTPLSHW